MCVALCHTSYQSDCKQFRDSHDQFSVVSANIFMPCVLTAMPCLALLEEFANAGLEAVCSFSLKRGGIFPDPHL